MTTEIKKIFEGSIDIHDLVDLGYEYSYKKNMPALWIELAQVTGIDYALLREGRLLNPDREFSEEEEIDDLIYSPDNILYDTLILAYIYQHEFKKTLEYLRKYEMPAIIKNFSLVATRLYSRSPGFGFPISLNLFTKENISDCVDVAMHAYEEADIYAKALLCINYVWTFDALFCKYDYDIGSEGSIPMDVLTQKQQDFMNKMYDCGLRYNNNEEDLREVRELRLQELRKEQSLQ